MKTEKYNIKDQHHKRYVAKGTLSKKNYHGTLNSSHDLPSYCLKKPEAESVNQKSSPPLSVKKTTCVFFHNLSYSTSEDELFTLVSSIVTPSRVVIARDKQGNSRGFAFVYIDKEKDAATVVDRLNNFEFQKRKLTVEFCVSRDKNARRKQVTLVSQLSDLSPLSRCVSIQFVPSFFAQVLKVNEMMPFLLPKSIRCFKAFHDEQNKRWWLQLSTQLEALSLAKSWGQLELSKHFLEQFLDQEKHKKIQEEDHTESFIELHISASCADKKNKSRTLGKLKAMDCLILRNLSFKAQKKDIFDLLKPYGVISRFKLPPAKKEGNDVSKQPHAGYAFVSFKMKESAEQALQALNGKFFFKRPLSVSWNDPNNSDPDQDFNLIDIPRPDLTYLQKLEGASDDDSDEDGKTSNKGQEDFESSSNEENMEKNTGGEDQNLKDEIKRVRDKALMVLKAKDDHHGYESSHSREKRTLENVEDSTKKVVDKDTGVDERSCERKKRRTEDAKDGRTIHVRNLPADVTREELRSLLASFGEITYVRLLKDKKEGIPPTAFVKFKNVDSAQELMQQQYKITNTICNEKDLRSDPVTSGLPIEGMGIILRQHRLHCSVAVTKEEAKRLEKNKNVEKEAAHADKVRLAHIGYIDEHTLQQQNVSKSDIRRRTEAQKEANIKLSNPNFTVNPLRLSVRNLPPHIRKQDLRCILIDYISNDSGCQKLLMNRKPINILRKSVKRRVAEKALKHLLLCYDKQGETTRTIHSRGFAFVTLTNHQVALRLLHYLNNNPTLFGPLRRPIVGFAIEDKRALHQHNLRAAKLMQCNSLEKSRKRKTYSRGKRQREKRRNNLLTHQLQQTK